MTTKAEIRFYLDENVENQIATGLRTRGIDVVTTPEAGHIGWKDEQHLVFGPQARTVKQILHGLILIYEILHPEDMENRIEHL